MTTRVSLAQLAAANIPLHPAEAVAVVSEICRQYSSGQLHGIPPLGVIRLTCEGAVAAEGPTTTDEANVRRAAHLLSDLLPDFDAPSGYRASGGLRLVIARALGTLDLPPYPTLQDFCQALGRFAVSDLGDTVRRLFRAWEQAEANHRRPASSPALTISDIRRARRATGLSLDALSAVACVPAARLRELEWGYFRNWKPNDDGRSQVMRYARAAGLDEAVVLSIAWPMIEEAVASHDERLEPGVALVPSGLQSLMPAPPIAQRRSQTSLVSWAVVAAAAALLALATYGVATGTARDDRPTLVASVPRPVMTQVPRPEEAIASPPLPVPPLAAPARRPAKGRQAARPAHGPQRRSSPRSRSFLDKELFRIVIR